MIEYTIDEHNLHIPQSYLIKKVRFGEILREIKEANPNSNVWKRKMFSLKMEWTVHNFLYHLGYKKAQTGDVDLDNPCDRPEWLYCTLGILMWIFVK